MYTASISILSLPYPVSSSVLSPPSIFCSPLSCPALPCPVSSSVLQSAPSIFYTLSCLVLFCPIMPSPLLFILPSPTSFSSSALRLIAQFLQSLPSLPHPYISLCSQLIASCNR